MYWGTSSVATFTVLKWVSDAASLRHEFQVSTGRKAILWRKMHAKWRNGSNVLDDWSTPTTKDYWPTVFCGSIVLDDWSMPMMKDYWSTIFRGPIVFSFSGSTVRVDQPSGIHKMMGLKIKEKYQICNRHLLNAKTRAQIEDKTTLAIHMLNIAGAKWDKDLYVACHRGKTGQTIDLF